MIIEFQKLLYIESNNFLSKKWNKEYILYIEVTIEIYNIYILVFIFNLASIEMLMSWKAIDFRSLVVVWHVGIRTSFNSVGDLKVVN